MGDGRPQLEIVDWGRLDYGTAALRQRQLAAQRLAAAVPDRLVLVEHPAVVTIGRNGTAGDLLLPEAVFAERGVEVCRAERGGRVTCHGPGQMVAYPIVALEERDLHRYVRTLLECVAALVREYGLEPVFKKGEPGLWVNGAKIASIGIAVHKWIASHGVALNVKNDLTLFSWIVPCGKPEEKVTSLAEELGIEMDMEVVRERFVEHFRAAFGYGRGRAEKLPQWLRHPVPSAAAMASMAGLLERRGLETVCKSAQCPNQGECFGRGTATFMILGEVCTRRCRFCAVAKGAPAPPDPGEPERVAAAAQELGLKWVVVTSVTRDDLADGGAAQFAATIVRLREVSPAAGIEVLVPDFLGSERALEAVLRARPDMFNHNIETVPRLYPDVRPQAHYRRSLAILKAAAAFGLPVKSGLMLGLGESSEEVAQALRDMRRAGCEYLTLGQYLAPSPKHAPVVRYLPPEEFDDWSRKAREMGFAEVAAGPLVRSSYLADRMIANVTSEQPVKGE